MAAAAAAASKLRPMSSLKGLGKSWILFNANSTDKLMQAGLEQDRLMTMWMGPVQSVIATHPDTARAVLSRPNDFIKQEAEGSGRERLQDPLYLIEGSRQRADLLGRNGHQWASMRKQMNPAFTREALDRLVPIFEQQVDKVIDRWSHETRLDVKDDMQHFALDVLGAAIFGLEFNALNGEFDETYDAYKKIMAASQEPAFLVFPWLENLPLKRNRDLTASVEHMIAFFKQVIRDRRAERAKGIVREHRDILDMILPDDNGEGGIPEETLVANMWIFLLAGHDTTAISLAWILSELSRRPEIQQRAREEAVAVMGAKAPGEAITAQDLESVPYISAVINESLRLHPPVYNIPTRITAHDTELDGVEIPGKTLVSIHIGAVNRHPSAWEDPHTFNPERFLQEKAPRVFHHLPFSAGPRRCIGDRFSLMEQKTLLLKLLPRFELTATDMKEPELGTDALPLVFYQPKTVELELKQI